MPSPLGPRQRRTRFLALPPDGNGSELLLGVCQDLTDSVKARSEQEDFERYRLAMNRLNAVLDGNRPEEDVLRDSVEAVREAFDADRCVLTFPCDPGADSVTVPPRSRFPWGRRD